MPESLRLAGNSIFEGLRFMLQDLKTRLAAVRTRQRLDRTLRWSTIGLIAGCSAACVLFLLVKLGWTSLAGEAGSTGLLSLLLPLVTTAAAAVLGFVLPIGWNKTAHLVDRICDLKDRTSTALTFASSSDADPIRRLQVEEAVSQLDRVKADQVLPIRSPRLAPVAVATVIAMIAFSFLGLPIQETNMAATNNVAAVVTEQAELLEETLIKDLEDLAEETEDEDLKELLEEMKEAIDELKDPEIDQREALAELSEMQAALTSAAKQMSVEQVDAQLQQLADALQASDSTQSASQALAEMDYDKAAKELEKIEASSMDPKDKKALESKLAKMKSNLGKGKKGELGEAVSEILEGLQNENDSQCKSGMCKAGGVCRKQSVKKKISDCLACQLNRLAECKCQCQGQCQNPSSSVSKSDSPKNSWGLGESNKPFGEEKTSLDSRRKQEDVTGQSGEGPSDRETTTTFEARQDAARSYKQRYTEFRKKMEEVIDSEPLPLGHRETVRKYFEAIRPDNGEGELQ